MMERVAAGVAVAVELRVRVWAGVRVLVGEAVEVEERRLEGDDMGEVVREEVGRIRKSNAIERRGPVQWRGMAMREGSGGLCITSHTITLIL